jgi:hypothetical protein
MDKKDLKFEDFLKDVNPAYIDFATRTHEYLLENGCAVKIDMAKNGYLVSYSDKKKRVILNFVFRKSGLVTRIYGDAINSYIDYVETIPEAMIKAIEKAPACKRMLDSSKCNSRCRMGYDFMLKGAHWQKCQYNCFMFPVTHESSPYIRRFLENELNARYAFN